MTNDTIDQLMKRSLYEVFGERDPARRLIAIQELYTENCAFFDEEQHNGRDAISARAGRLIQEHPGFAFHAVGHQQTNHDLGRLQWQYGPPEAPSAVTGVDIAVFQRGRIRALYVFVDEPSQK
jgi:hypothetical protein